MTTDELRLKWEHNLDMIECNMPFVSKMPEWDIAIALQNQIEEFLEDLKLLAAPAVSVELPLTEARLSALHDIAKQYCYTTQDDSPTISRKGVELLLVEYSKGN
jgi:hypothetical protein